MIITAPGTILIVDDEASIRHVVRAYLEHEGFRVVCIDNGQEAVTIAKELQPDLVILDLMLPGMDGMEVAARLRQESQVYILMLTARSEEADRVAGLRIGADDYLTKPFSPRELVARVQAILRRQRDIRTTVDSTLRFQHMQINPESREVHINGQPLELTTTEFDVLLALAQHANRVLSREQIIDLVWSDNFYGTDRVVDVYVGQVRRKLESATGETLIRTVRGVGYKFVDIPS
ncbi:MAG: response regulator transcription factor [Chloroflexi bacterium AL-W]|nr:response regulator transcription factor [Chloroflexi bacterium AL-N1]NOK67742.1 response regulator transcription factor [Chloroflexi bacterium AL-N10]NOK75488.1 response regulator transcription factor [Chloroflexi bacterium AL-N5]NOK82276.1 response regulator transcription factor [Chloroflexi bacterium AL-W]NOK90121.1 response regulator transcription factor [Chloroflexi bacterium AL-N15]